MPLIRSICSKGLSLPALQLQIARCASSATAVGNAADKWLDAHDRSFGHFINNKWYKPANRKTLKSTSPSSGKVLATTIQGNAEDVNVAVAAANEAAKSWAALPGYVRARHMYNVARAVQRNAQAVALLEAMDNGKCIFESSYIDIPMLIRHMDFHAGYAQLMDDTFHGKWKPVGVVGAIVPWNFPLMLMSWKICPALAMGNTVVLKSASVTRLSALIFAECCAEAGLPPGVFNVITGSGSMGSALANHPDVDKVALTGSTEIGQLLRRLTAGSGKKLSLELGGKSPMVVHPDSDLDMVVEGIMIAIYFNQGEVCAAGSRLVVHESIHDQLIEKLKARLGKFKVGESLDETVHNGAVVDETQWRSVEDYVRSARREGANVWQAWDSLPPAARATPEELAKGEVNPKSCGLFYPPTVITNVTRNSKVVREEIFGPVLVVQKFKTPQESVEIANDSSFGLVASVWTKNVSLALESCLNIKAGVTWMNAHNMIDPAVGFGGYKTSGYGRDGGKEGLMEYIKPAWMKNYRGGGPLSGRTVDLSKFGLAKKTDAPAVFGSTQLFIGGKHQPALSSRPILNANGAVVGHVGEANESDVKKAVAAAKAVAPVWSKRAAFNRSQILYQMAENVENRKNEFADKLSVMTGADKAKSLREVDLAIERLFYWAAYGDKFGGDVQEPPAYACTFKIHEPVGVVGIACPDEFPLLSFISLLAPALVRANTIVIAPSERYPLAALEFVKTLEASSIPAGVVNVLTGSRDLVAKHLAESSDIDSAWYFGSAEGSRCVEHASAENLKRTFVNYGRKRDWDNNEQGQGLEFLYHACQAKNIWIPIRESFMK